MSRIVGIDLGTTNSLVAYMEKGVPVIIPDEEGNNIVPSVVAFEEQNLSVGHRANRYRSLHPEKVVYSVKRLMGRGAGDIQKELKFIPFRLSDEKEGSVRIVVDGKKYTPPEISAMILKQLKSRAEAYFKERIERAVITVPAYFDDSQRQATKDAGRIAGLEVVRIVNEPTAASLAYGLQRKKQGVIAVYDLGGGTFDISILKIKDGIFEVLSTHGDTHLGGDDFDNAIVALALDSLKQNLSKELESDRVFLESLREKALSAKIELSDKEKTYFRLEGWKQKIELELTREDFERLIDPLVQRTVASCQIALRDAHLKPENIDEVVLVGGSTRIPYVRKVVESVFRKTPKCELNPEEVVALGAAVQAGILSGDNKDLLLLDVTPLALGIETFGGIVSRLIERNTVIPAVAREVFTTFVDGQTHVEIHVLQGDRELVKDNRSLACFTLMGIAPKPAGLPRIEVTFMIDANGILKVSAKDLESGREQSMRVQPTYGLTETEIHRMIKESMELAKEDIEARLLIEARNDADIVIRSTEKALKEHSRLMERDKVRPIEDQLQKLRLAREGARHELIRQETKLLNEVTQNFAQLIMQEELKRKLKGKKLSEI